MFQTVCSDMNFHWCICVLTWSSFYIDWQNVTEFGPNKFPYKSLRFILRSNFINLWSRRVSYSLSFSTSIIEEVYLFDVDLSCYLSPSFASLTLDFFLVKKDQHPLVLFDPLLATSFDIIKSCLLFRLNLMITFVMASAII